MAVKKPEIQSFKKYEANETPGMDDWNVTIAAARLRGTDSETVKAFKKILRPDYMGVADLQVGSVQDTLDGMAASTQGEKSKKIGQKLDLVFHEFRIGDEPGIQTFIIAPRELIPTYEKFIADYEFPNERRYRLHTDAFLTKTIKLDQPATAYLDVNNSVFFTNDKDVFETAKKTLGVDKEYTIQADVMAKLIENKSAMKRTPLSS